MELYAQAFEEAGALDKLEAFASFYGADFYGLPRNKDHITLQKQNWVVPEELVMQSATIVPLDAGTTLAWKMV
jgi:dihydroorotase